MILTVLVSEFAVESGDLLPEFSDLVDQLHVVLHDVVVVLLVDLSLLLQTLLERVDRVLKVPLLVLVLLLDVRVYLHVLYLLVLHVRVQVLIDTSLELVEVVNELDSPVDSVGESLDEDVVGSYLGPVLLDQLLHVLLPGPQVVYDVAEVGIDLVVVLKVLVHFIGLLLQTSDLHLPGRDVPLELLDLVVQHELELLQLLRLLLQLIYLLLSITDELVLGRYLTGLVLDVLLERVEDLVLVSDLDALLLLVSLEFLDIALQVLVLVLGQLQLCLRLETHVLHLRLVLHVLLVDLLDLELGICIDLSECLLVVLPDLVDVVVQLHSRVFRSLHVLLKLVQLLPHTLVVLVYYPVYLALIVSGLFFLLSLQFLEVGSISKHLLRVGLPLQLQLSLALLCKLPDLFLLRVLNITLILSNRLEGALLCR